MALEKISSIDDETQLFAEDGKQGQGQSLESRVGEKIRYFGDYEVIEEIARGGMGVVYKAKQTTLNRIVALKMILSGRHAGGEEVGRFHTEAKAAANLDHPGIVPIFEVGEHEGQHYFSMGFVEGRSLADRINESPLEPREAANLLIKIARAVAYANETGVIHRDLKPGNVLLDEAGEPRVTDFGLAKRLADDSGITATGQILGTPSYMPPEQAMGKADEVGPRADVYALGAILYATLTGRPPFQAANPMETLTQVMEQEPVSVRQLVPRSPRDLETICLKCLHKEAGRRYATGDDFADDLQRWLDGEPIVARRVSRAERAWKWCRRKPLLMGSVAMTVLILVVGSVVFWERQTASHVDGLVSSLATADAADVPGLLDEIGDYDGWSSPRLRDRLESSDEGSKEELHMALALLADDPSQTETLIRRLPKATPSQVQLIRTGLAEHASSDVAQSLWETVNDTNATQAARLNAACVLAAAVPSDERWTGSEDAVALLLVKALALNPRSADALISMLEPVRLTLSMPIGDACHDSELEAIERDWASTVLVAYAIDQASVLCDVAMDSAPKLFERLLPLIESLREESVPEFVAAINRSLDETDDPFDKDQIGQRQANAAIALLRLSLPEKALNVLNRRRDPRAVAWFVDRVDEYAVSPELLLDNLDVENADDASLTIQINLLQSLAQFEVDQLPTQVREPWVPRLLRAYQHHPDPGLHGSVAWLLRQWGLAEELMSADKALQLEREEQEFTAESESRQWYVNGQGQTMVVLKAGEFMMGTKSDSDPNIEDDEIFHRRVINRSIAVSSTEVTREQFRNFENDRRPNDRLTDVPQLLKVVRTADSAMTAITFYEATAYCNWLSDQEGIKKDQWCYLPNENGDHGTGMRVRENFWELSGYRLPTEAEWEYACRAGSETRYYYGHVESLLPRYGRFDLNGERHSWPVGSLPPNAWGLFGMLGNAYEWTLDEYDSDYSEANRIVEGNRLVAIVDELNSSDIADQYGRVTRGGSFDFPARGLRSANRDTIFPNNRGTVLGFRVVRTNQK